MSIHARPIDFQLTSALAHNSFCSAVKEKGSPLVLFFVSNYFVRAMTKAYIVTFRGRLKDHPPSKFVVLADDMKEAIDVAWEHGGPDFHAYFEKTSAQAQEMEKGALRVL
jgi:hypothetical protein